MLLRISSNKATADIVKSMFPSDAMYYNTNLTNSQWSCKNYKRREDGTYYC